MTELGMCSGFVVAAMLVLCMCQGLQASDTNWAPMGFALCCLLLAVQSILKQLTLLLCCGVSGVPSCSSS